MFPVPVSEHSPVIAGAGKSYSMVGYPGNRGIIPIVCEELFRKIDSQTSETTKFQVTVSMLEIYNEAIRDLLNPANNPPGGLQVRTKPGIGVYVENLTPVPVTSYGRSWTDEGFCSHVLSLDSFAQRMSRGAWRKVLKIVPSARPK